MNEKAEHQQKLMELVVDKVLKKHGVLGNPTEVDPSEKAKIAEIVENIKVDVENYLENAKVAKTEKDFSETNTTDVVKEQVGRRKSSFTSNNDVKAVKKFF